VPKKPRNPKRSLAWGQGYVTVTGATKAQARWKVGAHWRAKTFHAPTLAEAIGRAEEHIRAESRYTPDPDSHDMTVSDIVEAWLRRGKTRWTPNTYSQYEMHYRRHIKPTLGTVRAREVTTARIQRWIDGLVGEQLAPASIRLIYTVLTGPFKEATRLEIIRVNPARGVVLPAIRRSPKPTWTVEHIQKVFASLNDDPFWNAVYRFALTTGVRPGELIALRWSDLDFERGQATIARTLTRNERRQYVIGSETKTHQPRTVAVPASTLTALRQWRAEQDDQRSASSFWLDADLVFTATYGYHLEPKTWAAYNKRLCARAGVPPITPHCTRHTLATLMMAANEHPVVVQHILGHDSIRTTLGTYSHSSIELQTQAITALDERLTGTKSATKRAKSRGVPAKPKQ
jgi:integrase